MRASTRIPRIIKMGGIFNELLPLVVSNLLSYKLRNAIHLAQKKKCNWNSTPSFNASKQKVYTRCILMHLTHTNLRNSIGLSFCCWPKFFDDLTSEYPTEFPNELIISRSIEFLLKIFSSSLFSYFTWKCNQFRMTLQLSHRYASENRNAVEFFIQWRIQMKFIWFEVGWQYFISVLIFNEYQKCTIFIPN